MPNFKSGRFRFKMKQVYNIFYVVDLVKKKFFTGLRDEKTGKIVKSFKLWKKVMLQYGVVFRRCLFSRKTVQRDGMVEKMGVQNEEE